MGMSIVIMIQGGIPLQNIRYVKSAYAATKKQEASLEPKALPVKIGKKVKDSEIAVDGIHAMSNYEVASSKKEFTKKLYQKLTARKTNFTIVYKGPYNHIYKNKKIDTIFAPAWNIDRKSTSDDFDYLYGNIDTYAFRVPVYSAHRSVFTFKIKYREGAERLKMVNQNVAIALENLDLEGRSRVEKLLRIHNFIALLVTYQTGTITKYTAYDGLVSNSHECVCQGYALIFYKICTEANIPCRFVIGKGVDQYGYTVPHAWNMVKVGNKWYYVDVTWDDPDNWAKPVTYDYFLVGKNKINKEHILAKKWKSAKYKKKYKIASKNYKWKASDFSTVTTTTTPTATVMPTTTVVPTATAGQVTTARPSATPSTTPSRNTTARPIATPSWNTTARPIATPSWNTTARPSATPSWNTTARPTATPSWNTTARPTTYITESPTQDPHIRMTVNLRRILGGMTTNMLIGIHGGNKLPR